MLSPRLLPALILTLAVAPLTGRAAIQKPSRSEVVQPLRNETYDRSGKAKDRVQGGNPRTVNGAFVFDGSQDGDRQVDPQIAVGAGRVFHGTNSGTVVYDKEGKRLRGVAHDVFNSGIDPKLLFDVHNRVFAFDIWCYWDKEKIKPVNVCVTETDNPLGAWNIYPVSVPKGVDGGAIGCSRAWLGYSFPGGPEQTFLLKTAEAKAGKPATVHHFAGGLGHPVNTLDPVDDLYFLKLTDKDIVVTRVAADAAGTPEVVSVETKPHGFAHFGWPPAAPQKGTDKKVAPGDRNPKNVVFMHGHLWFSHVVAINGRSAVQWHQLKPDGTLVQSGTIAHPTNSYIQTTLAVNKAGDVLIGFQECGPDMFVSPRFALHRAGDAPGATGPVTSLGEGLAASAGGAWGDYSGTVVDGDNLTDLWTIQSIADDHGKGDTVIAKITPALIPGKPAAVQLPLTPGGGAPVAK